MKSQYEISEGKLKLTVQYSVDTDKDGKPAIEGENVTKFDLVEVISEIAKKELPLLETIVKQFKV